MATCTFIWDSWKACTSGSLKRAPTKEHTCLAVPCHGGLSLIGDAQDHNLELCMLGPCQAQALLNALQHAVPDLQRIMLNPSACQWSLEGLAQGKLAVA